MLQKILRCCVSIVLIIARKLSKVPVVGPYIMFWLLFVDIMEYEMAEEYATVIEICKKYHNSVPRRYLPMLLLTECENEIKMDRDYEAALAAIEIALELSRSSKKRQNEMLISEYMYAAWAAGKSKSCEKAIHYYFMFSKLFEANMKMLRKYAIKAYCRDLEMISDILIEYCGVDPSEAESPVIQ